VDALVCSGYKWLSAPSGVALLAATENLAAATPVIVGWKGSATPFDFTPQEPSLAELWPAVKAVAKELVHRPDELHNDDVAAIAAAAIGKA
jgi:selenocysteine lyase/cysteine desulfurase